MTRKTGMRCSEGVTMKFQRVRVTKWCNTRAESWECLEKVVVDTAEIDEALAVSPWTSAKLLALILNDFRNCVERRGGKAEIIE
jgi:hypothetical protein